MDEQNGFSSCTTTSSSCSGSVSTAYTSSTGSHPFYISMEATLHLDLELNGEKKMERVQEFLGLRQPSANCSINGGGSVSGGLERWFTELGVRWVLHVDDGASAGKLEHAFDARSWIWALAEVTEITRSTAWLFQDRGGGGGVPDQLLLRRVTSKLFRRVTSKLSQFGINSAEESETTRGEQFPLTRFTKGAQEAMVKILASVDAIVALDPNTTREVSIPDEVPAPYHKIHILLGVRRAMSNALSRIRLPSCSRPSAEFGRIQGDIVRLLSAKEAKACEAVWSTIQEIRARILDPVEDADDGSPQRSSSDIHKATRSVISFIRFLHSHYSSVAPIIVSEAASFGKCVPKIGGLPPLDSMIMEVASCVQEKLANKSKSFADQGLMFLFLLNNTYLIRQQLLETSRFRQFDVAGITSKISSYIESYLQVSWSPVLACLFHPTPHCCKKTGRAGFTLPKFESEFQKTYTSQKLWKVPDPELRKTLRKAITDKIIPSYTKYVEDNNFTTPNLTPQNLEEMLQELLEG